MLLDYERFVHKPVQRKPAPTPIVRRELVRPVEKETAPPEPAPAKPLERIWPEKWLKLATLYDANPLFSLADCGRRVGLDHSSVWNALTKMGVHDPVARKTAKARAMAERDARMKLSALVAQTKRAQASVEKFQRAQEFRLRSQRVKAARRRNIISQNEKVRAIKQAIRDGLTNTEIMARLQTTRSVVCKIRSGATWKTVP